MTNVQVSLSFANDVVEVICEGEWHSPPSVAKKSMVMQFEECHV
jgi:hypothetical protein